MRRDHLYISSVGVWLPPRETATAAIAAGRYDVESWQRTRQDSTCVAAEPAVDLAVRAAQVALRRSAHQPDDVALVLYATAHYQGLDAWNAAGYVQHRTVGDGAFGVEIRQLSNGGMAAIELAARYLRSEPSRPAALLVTGDRFALPAFDRWRADRNLVWGDAGTAMVLSREHGVAALLSLASVADTGLEELHRGDAPLRTAPSPQDMPIDLRTRKRQFLARTGSAQVRERLFRGQQAAIDRALADAGTPLETISRVVVPHSGAHDEWQHLAPLDSSLTTSRWGRTVGHLGAGDQYAGLDHLLSSGELRIGDRVLVIGGGGGYNWTCAVVEIIESPQWTDS